MSFDGLNDHTVLQLNAGLFSTQLSWSPDGRQIAFDLGRQSTNNTLEAMPNTIEISVVNMDGSDPHPVRGPPAAMPAWQPTSLAPSLSIRLNPGNPPTLLLTWPTPAQSMVLEAADLTVTAANWRPVNAPIISAGGQNSVTLKPDAKAAFFRLRLPATP